MRWIGAQSQIDPDLFRIEKLPGRPYQAIGIASLAERQAQEIIQLKSHPGAAANEIKSNGPGAFEVSPVVITLYIAVEWRPALVREK